MHELTFSSRGEGNGDTLVASRETGILQDFPVSILEFIHSSHKNCVQTMTQEYLLVNVL